MDDLSADAVKALRSKVGIVKMFSTTEAGSKEDDDPPVILHWPALIFDSVEIFESAYKQALVDASLPKLPVTLGAVATELLEHRKEKRRSGTTSKVEGKVAFLLGEDRMPKLAFENEFRSVFKVGDEKRPIEPVYDMECVADVSLPTVEAHMLNSAFSQATLILSGNQVGERNEINDAPELSPLRLCYHEIMMIDGPKTKHIFWSAIRIRNTKNFILEIAEKISKANKEKLMWDAFDIDHGENNTVYLFGRPPSATPSKIIPYDGSKVRAHLSLTLRSEYVDIQGYTEAVQESVTVTRTVSLHRTNTSQNSSFKNEFTASHVGRQPKGTKRHALNEATNEHPKKKRNAKKGKGGLARPKEEAKIIVSHPNEMDQDKFHHTRIAETGLPTFSDVKNLLEEVGHTFANDSFWIDGRKFICEKEYRKYLCRYGVPVLDKKIHVRSLKDKSEFNCLKAWVTYIHFEMFIEKHSIGLGDVICIEKIGYHRALKYLGLEFTSKEWVVPAHAEPGRELRAKERYEQRKLDTKFATTGIPLDLLDASVEHFSREEQAGLLLHVASLRSQPIFTSTHSSLRPCVDGSAAKQTTKKTFQTFQADRKSDETALTPVSASRPKPTGDQTIPTNSDSNKPVFPTAFKTTDPQKVAVPDKANVKRPIYHGLSGPKDDGWMDSSDDSDSDCTNLG